MSEKRNVPTFRVFVAGVSEPLQGPIVAVDKQEVGENFQQAHELLRQDAAILVYDRQWQYIPAHSIERILRGTSRFSLPWPLTGESESDE